MEKQSTTFERTEMISKLVIQETFSGSVALVCFKLTGVFRKTSHVCLRPVLKAKEKAERFGPQIQCDFGFFSTTLTMHSSKST